MSDTASNPSPTAMIQNPIDKPILVLKFGGTSVGKFIQNICGQIIPTDVKSKGTTTRLVKAADAVLSEVAGNHEKEVQEILEDHLEAIQENMASEQIKDGVSKSLTEVCRRLKVFLDAAEVINEVSPKSKDIIVGTGEKLA
ncbi:Aspartokinase, partial [Kickxella alabastrina]